MELRESLHLEPILYELQQTFTSSQDTAMFVLALGKPTDLAMSRVPKDFWQSDIRSWIGRDYKTRLHRVLEAHKLLRPNDRPPGNW